MLPQFRVVEILDNHFRVVGYRASWTGARNLALTVADRGGSSAIEHRFMSELGQAWIPIITLEGN